jgi:uncharacterized membrane protein
MSMLCPRDEQWGRRNMPEKETMAKGAILKYKIHWHVALAHFPISFFSMSFGFMVLHLSTRKECYESAAFLSLAAGAVIMLPAMLTGWLTWKGRYKGMRGRTFIYKIRIAFAMLAGGTALAILRALLQGRLHTIWLAAYTAGILLLSLGAIAEGYYGGRLNHR